MAFNRIPNYTARQSLRQPANHGQYPIRHAFQFRINLGQRARRLEDVEVTVEGNLVADLGLVMVDLGIGRVGPKTRQNRFKTGHF